MQLLNLVNDDTEGSSGVANQLWTGGFGEGDSSVLSKHNMMVLFEACFCLEKGFVS